MRKTATSRRPGSCLYTVRLTNQSRAFPTFRAASLFNSSKFSKKSISPPRPHYFETPPPTSSSNRDDPRKSLRTNFVKHYRKKKSEHPYPSRDRSPERVLHRAATSRGWELAIAPQGWGKSSLERRACGKQSSSRLQLEREGAACAALAAPPLPLDRACPPFLTRAFALSIPSPSTLRCTPKEPISRDTKIRIAKKKNNNNNNAQSMHARSGVCSTAGASCRAIVVQCRGCDSGVERPSRG